MMEDLGLAGHVEQPEYSVCGRGAWDEGILGRGRTLLNASINIPPVYRMEHVNRIW